MHCYLFNFLALSFLIPAACIPVSCGMLAFKSLQKKIHNAYDQCKSRTWYLADNRNFFICFPPLTPWYPSGATRSDYSQRSKKITDGFAYLEISTINRTKKYLRISWLFIINSRIQKRKIIYLRLVIICLLNISFICFI